MSDVKPMTSDLPVNEMELSAEDLLAFEQPAPSKPAPVLAAAAAVEPVAVPEPLHRLDEQQAQPIRGRANTAMFKVAAAVIAVAAAVSLFAHTRQPGESRIATAARQDTPVAAVVPPESPAEVQPPVRIVNSFDKSEVFEFPAGTSMDEARARVADLLIKRAMERQQQFAVANANGR